MSIWDYLVISQSLTFCVTDLVIPGETSWHLMYKLIWHPSVNNVFIYVHLISAIENIYNLWPRSLVLSSFIFPAIVYYFDSHWFWNILMNHSTTRKNNTEVTSTVNLFPQKFKLSGQCNLFRLTVSIYPWLWLKTHYTRICSLDHETWRSVSFIS